MFDAFIWCIFSGQMVNVITFFNDGPMRYDVLQLKYLPLTFFYSRFNEKMAWLTDLL